MNVFSIKDIENLSGVKAHTIRIWEHRYSFLNPCRTHTNIRYYSTHELKMVLKVSLLTKYGYKISHIDRMTENEITEKIIALSAPGAQHERIGNELIEYMVDLDSDGFEKTLNNCINRNGIEKTIITVIYPFLERIGVLWHPNNINAAQEHAVSNIIRQKLVAGIGEASGYLQVNKTILLFLPEGEHHELGLLFIYYLLKSRGLNVLYLGVNVPIKDIEVVAKMKRTDALFTHFSTPAPDFNIEKYILKVTTQLSSIPFVVSGNIVRQFKKKLPPKVFPKRSFQELIEYISAID